jgi:glycosyltransferase
LKVSIITVCYNSQNTIQDTIDSIINQSCRNSIEYIVIDGYSTDKTKSILFNNFDNIDIILSEPDKGLYDAMNKGIKMATGDIIGILNSDDLLYSKYTVEDIIKTFIDNPQIDFIYGDLVYVDQFDTFKVKRKWKSKKITNNYFKLGNVPAHPTIYIKNKVINQILPYDLSFKFASDYDFILRLFLNLNFKSFYLNKYLVKMRLGGLTSKNLKNRILQNKEIVRSWEKNKQKIPFYFFPSKLLIRLLQFI